MHRNHQEFMTRNGLVFQRQDLLQTALTHSTYAYEHTGNSYNERLEFLGDAVLQLATSELLYKIDPKLSEGKMTKYRALIVCEETLTLAANKLELGEYLRLGKGEEQTGGRFKPSNLSNAMEAVLGALFLDQGYDRARDFTCDLLREYCQLAIQGKLVYDFKSKLIEYAQAKQETLAFEIIDTRGEVHNRVFTAQVRLAGKVVGEGSGTSKKDAEQQAAKQALGDLQCI